MRSLRARLGSRKAPKRDADHGRRLAGFWQITDHQWGGFGPEHDQRMAMKIALRPTWKGNLLMLVVALIVLFVVAS